MKGFLAPLGVLVIATVVSLVVGEGNTRRAVLLSGGIAAAVWIVGRIAAPSSELAGIAANEGLGDALKPLQKGVGIAWATAITSLALRELGSPNIASYAELVGAAELIVLAFPLVSELLSLALSLV